MGFIKPIGQLDRQAAYTIRTLNERVSKLEEKVFKTARKDSTTVRQQILILHHLGFLEKLNDFKLSRDKKAKLLSILLNGSFDNIRDYLTEVLKKDSELKTENNYSFLVKTFKEAGLKKQEEEVDIILDQLIKELSEK